MIVTTNFVPHGFDALTLWPFVFVRPERADDAPLMAHEMVHYREQAWRTPVWVLRYLLSRRFRLAAEVRAYKVQIALGGITPDGAADMLLRYDLDITNDQALEALA